MYRKNIYFLVAIFSLFIFQSTIAKDNVPNPNNNSDNGLRVVAAGCLPATSSTELNINNVRTLILGGGDLYGVSMLLKYNSESSSMVYLTFLVPPNI